MGIYSPHVPLLLCFVKNQWPCDKAILKCHDLLQADNRWQSLPTWFQIQVTNILEQVNWWYQKTGQTHHSAHIAFHYNFPKLQRGAGVKG